MQSGDRYGRWTVLGDALVEPGSRHQKKRKVWCRCDCGTQRLIPRTILTRGKSRSCGCGRRDCRPRLTHGAAAHRSHGATPEYRTWCHIIGRCNNPTDKAYRHYGARGIRMCQAWAESYEAFFKDMGPRPSPKHSIHRINNDGNYEPGNCRWATALEQGSNTRKCRFLTHNGVTQHLAEWARQFGLDPKQLQDRLSRGWSLERALTLPVMTRPSREAMPLVPK